MIFAVRQKGAKMDKDVIYRQDAIDALCDNCDNVQAVCPHYPCKQYTAIDALSPAQPQIIRCENCRYYEWTSNRVPDEQTWFCYNWNAETGKDDFCSYAERREDG